MDAFVNLTGYVGGDVELRHTKSGVTCASVRVATTPRIRRHGDWMDGETTWLTVVCYRALAENARASIARGDAVLLVGKLRTQVWTDANHVEHERLVLEASTIGHDLSRGTALFQRAERQPTTEDPFELAELIEAAERNAAIPEVDDPHDVDEDSDEDDADARSLVEDDRRDANRVPAPT